MPAPLAIQLWSVRNLLKDNFNSVITRIADLGYVGIESGTFVDVPPIQVGTLVRSCGLEVCSLHSFPVQKEEDLDSTLDILDALDCRTLVTGGGPDNFNSEDAIKLMADKMNTAYDLLTRHDIRLGMHNHWWEYLKVGERYAYEILLDYLTPQVFFEIDTYWVKTAGVDPAKVVKKLGSRAPMLHIKDGPAVRDQMQTAIGDGVLDFPSIVKASGDNVEWMIIEFDNCAIEILPAIEKSYQYLVGNHLARGNK